MAHFVCKIVQYFKSVFEKTRQNQAEGDTAQITNFAETWHKCWV